MSAVGETSDVETRVEFLAVRVGDDRYAVEVGNVRRLASFDPAGTTRVPNTPAAVAGVTTVDGDVTVVVDGRETVGDTVTGISRSGDSRLVVFARDGRPVGLAVDEFLGIEVHATDRIVPPGETTDGVDGRWCNAFIDGERGLTPVIDPDRIVATVAT